MTPPTVPTPPPADHDVDELDDRYDRIYGDDSPLAAGTFGFLSDDE